LARPLLNGRADIQVDVRLPKKFSRIKPTKTNNPTKQNHMSQETNKPESISDEQLEDVAGGMMDNTIGTENCSAALSTINL
jgi:hypothetical protein